MIVSEFRFYLLQVKCRLMNQKEIAVSWKSIGNWLCLTARVKTSPRNAERSWKRHWHSTIKLDPKFTRLSFNPFSGRGGRPSNTPCSLTPLYKPPTRQQGAGPLQKAILRLPRMKVRHVTPKSLLAGYPYLGNVRFLKSRIYGRYTTMYTAACWLCVWSTNIWHWTKLHLTTENRDSIWIEQSFDTAFF